MTSTQLCIKKKDLNRCKIIDSPLCSCGKVEDAYHYFFSCVKYNIPRNDLFNVIFRIENLNIIDTHVLLWGDNSFSITENENLFFNVQLFLKRSRRFNIV